MNAGYAAYAAPLMVALLAPAACDKKDDSAPAPPTNAAQVAPAAAAGSGEQERRAHEHDWDGGHEREHAK